ncbi:MAG: hypothetical protein JXR73_15795 [Candidatus Omnitrophica bacterium]|nr:hypothetical protein [Candidatus Omnitrophota bacterium]
MVGCEADIRDKAKNLWIWGLLALPLIVYFLPEFQTTFQEDFLVLAVFFYLLLRTANEKRALIDFDDHPLWLTFLLGTMYAVGWIGLLRGYMESLGGWLILYPAPLLACLVFSRRLNRDAPSKTQIFTITIVLFSVILFGFTGFFYWAGDQEIINAGLVSDRSLLSRLLIFPIIGCTALSAGRTPVMRRGRDHLPFLLMALLAAASVWSGNIQTWAMWYKAGELERAWTPFKYDDPEEIQLADNKPYEAAHAYLLVRERLLQKGEIPRYMNWPLFMQYRMAYQMMRKRDAQGCALALPPGGVSIPRHIEMIKKLWHLEFMWSIRDCEPNFPKDGRIWVDGELDGHGVLTMLNCWGRVYSMDDPYCWIEWESKGVFNDAVDLEIIDGAYVVLRRSGEIQSSKPLKALGGRTRIQSKMEDAVDFEVFSSQTAAVVVDAYGEMQLFGDPPLSFPSWRKLRFPRPVIADLELEPFENGYYVLDLYGAVHANHAGGMPSIPTSSPPVPKENLPYWQNQDMAVDLELDPQGRGLYVYNRLGEMYTISVAPYRAVYRPEKVYPQRGLALVIDPSGTLYAVESNGRRIQIP